MSYALGYQAIIYILVLGASFAWVFRRIGLIDVAGYIIGGVLLALIMDRMGFDIAGIASYTELISWIGLVLFSFMVGTSIGFKTLSLSFNRLIATELIIILIQWIASGFIVSILGLDFIARMTLFLILINSSSIAVLAVERINFSVDIDIRRTAYVQTQLEDIIQFTLFSLFTAFGLSMLQPLDILIQIAKVGGLAIILISLSRYMLKFLSRSPFIASKEGKFFTSIAIALIFTSIATILGLPPLFGAFIAGISFSFFLDLSDIADRLEGLRDLGLLLYFSLLGFQLYLGLRDALNIYTLITNGITIGILAFIARSIGIALGSIFSGYSLEICVLLSMLLTPLSEVGIMFVDTLSKQGVVPRQVVHMFMISFLTSLTAFSLIVPRLATRTHQILKLIPRRIVSIIDMISQEYTKRISALSSALFKVMVFASIVLAISYIDTLVKHLVNILHLPILLSALSTIISVVAILVIFVVLMRKIVVSLIISPHTIARKLDPLGKLIDIAIGGIAIVLQIQILHDFASRYILIEPLNIVTVVLVLAVILITLYDTIRFLRSR